MIQERKTTPAASSPIGLLARPLTARSIVASLLLGMHPPRQSSARIVRWCALLGVSENATRVALSRMVEAGELTSDSGVYELAGPVRRRQATQDWALDPTPAAWDGTWTMLVVRDDRRSADQRKALRAAAARSRLASPREGLWTRPDNLPPEADRTDDRSLIAEQCERWRARPDGDARVLAATFFDVDAWAARGHDLADHLAAVAAQLAADPSGGPGALASGFVAGAAALQHLRRDPLLPAELVPDRWPGRELRDRYRAYQQAFERRATAFLG